MLCLSTANSLVHRGFEVCPQLCPQGLTKPVGEAILKAMFTVLTSHRTAGSSNDIIIIL
jgi:hypothetical protein